MAAIEAFQHKKTKKQKFVCWKDSELVRCASDVHTFASKWEEY